MKKNIRTAECEDTETFDLDVLVPSQNISLLFGVIGDMQASKVVSWIITNNLASEDEQVDELTIIINSPGGDLSSAFSIIETMRGSHIPIKTIGMGQIYSAALLVFMAGDKGSRILTPTCSIMSHQFSTQAEGTYQDFKTVSKEMDHSYNRMLDHYAMCTGKSKSYLQKNLLNPGDTWLLPQDAVKHKLADQIAELEL